jgi:VIT1/CCC1 family predicted Fe2+/Mn2+ transporter
MSRRPRNVGTSSWAALQAIHRSVSGNTIRAAVLGANDGLVSNLSLVAGVAGASLAANTILITGFAGWAGACAMAMGEWISVQTSREVYERELRVETEELERFPGEETDELAALYESRGLEARAARQLAESVIANQQLALEVMAR